MSTKSQTFDTFDKVNRLIIIGNGFDLAHGMKTSFIDFLTDYLKQSLYTLYLNQRFQDDLISISTKNTLYYQAESIKHLSVSDLISLYSDILKHQDFKIKYTSKLLDTILQHLNNKNWVDIEVIYYELLKALHQIAQINEIKKLNADLNFLRIKLTDYLLTEQNKNKIETNDNILKQFTQEVKLQEVKSSQISGNKLPDKICLLSFNYTDLSKEYFNQINYGGNIFIPIHGQLNGNDKDSQKPIFGFGDELDSHYTILENQKDDELLKHIKSFKYLQFSYYKTLLDFIEQGAFQVHIYGHSCGLSDRTLLNTIFEHDNCISIKPFYYESDGKDDYEQKSYAIARNFKSKAELSARAVNKKNCEPMAQPATIEENK